MLTADVDELGRLGIQIQEAFDRGRAALGDRVVRQQLGERPGTEAGLAEVRDAFAEAAADLRLIRFAYATKAPVYRRSASEYDALEERSRELRRDVVPQLRARLRELRAREQALERELHARGLEPGAIGPRVAPSEAIDPTPKPGEGAEPLRLPGPLPPRRSLLDRLLGR